MNPPRTRLEEGATPTAGITETKASSDTPKETVATFDCGYLALWGFLLSLIHISEPTRPY